MVTGHGWLWHMYVRQRPPHPMQRARVCPKFPGTNIGERYLGNHVPEARRLCVVLAGWLL